MFFKFIWNGPDRVKREQTYQKYDKGGLKMVNLENFIIALKLTWFRRILSGPKKWQTGFYSILENYVFFWKTGPVYIAEKLPLIHNPFWKDIFTAWVTFCRKRKITTPDDIKQESLWFNDKYRNTTLCYQSWAKKNVSTINDIILSNGDVMT